MEYLNAERLGAIDASAFLAQRPYPWVNPEGLLHPGAYQRLVETLPDLSLFTPVFGGTRKHGQQFHDRYALEYRADLALAEPWRAFIAELQGAAYARFLRRMLNRRFFRLRFHWHYQPNGCAISPHCDSTTKFGSHIFYFNTAADWQAEWGGQTLILDDGRRLRRRSAPAFEDFDDAVTAETLGNRSLLFAQRERSWHGMQMIQCPEHVMRKVFIVVINDALRTAGRDLIRRLSGQPAKGY